MGETDNALKLEWFSLFPSLETLKIITDGTRYAFRMDVLLQSMNSISPTLSVIVEDRNQWVQKAMTDKVSAQYLNAGLNTEYEKQYDGWIGRKGALFIKPILQ